MERDILKDFDAIYNIMDASFPDSEMRTYDGQKELLKNKRYYIKTNKSEEGKIQGFLAYWKLSNCTFLEHLAVSESARGKGIGGKLIEDAFKENEGNVFFEVEPATDDFSKKRIKFYQKRGAHLNEFYYEQPSLRPTEDAQRLFIMSYPNPISEEDFKKYKNEIYKNVYNIDTE